MAPDAEVLPVDGSPPDDNASSEKEIDQSTTTPRSRSSLHRHRRGYKRNAAACERCRRRKQKCDGKLPTCSNCAAAATACVPSQRLVIRMDPNCNCDALREQVVVLEARIAGLTADLADTEAHVGSQTGVRPSAQPQPGETRVERFYSGRILLPTFPPREASSGTTNASFLSSPWQLWGDTRDDDEDTLSLARGGELLLAHSFQEDGNDLVNTFFARRWPQLPVLHKPTFLHEHFIPLSNGLPGQPLSAFMVNMVFAIAAIERPSKQVGSRVMHQHYFQLAVRDIGAVLTADDVECIQCLLLLVMYGINEPQSVNLWYTIGLALRMAVGIDMHRQEAAAPNDLLKTEMRKRLWWSVYVMDRSISMALGRPLGIQDGDITTLLPEPFTDDQLSAPQENIATSRQLPDVRDTSTLIHTVKLRRLNAFAYSTLHAAGDAGIVGTEDLNEIRHQHYLRLNEWLVSAPRYLNPPSMFQTSEWFNIAYHQAVMTLYRPSYASVANTVEDIRLCADSSISLITCYSALYAKNKISYSFVALNSLFMAAVTMLHSLRASWALRQELTKEIVEYNVRLCASLLRDIAGGRAVGDHSASIIERLGKATLNVYDNASTVSPVGEVDTEFLSWFGLKSQHLPQPGGPTPSIDIPWNDLLATGVDMSGSVWADLFL